MCLRRPRRFVASEAELEQQLRQAKLTACPHCGRVGTLIGHGLVRGYCERSQQVIIRGRRLFCSNRARRRGCGLTFSVLLSRVLGGFVVRTRTLFDFVHAVLQGRSRRAAWRRVAAGALSAASGYRLWRRLSEAQPYIRSKLCTVAPAPASSATEPWAQLVEHLKSVLPSASCCFSAFQTHFQTDLMG